MTIKPLLDQLAGYDLWANTRFIDRLSKENDAILDAAVPSSFPSLRATLLHIRDAHNTWCGRLTGTPTTWPAEAGQDIGSLLKYAVRLQDQVRGMDETTLLQVMHYHDLRGNAHVQPAWQMIMHAFNHGTYHRGQVVTMMRVLKLDDIPNTDLVRYQRSLTA
jgi:uncharacterized damage-inducible protein DinB